MRETRARLEQLSRGAGCPPCVRDRVAAVRGASELEGRLEGLERRGVAHVDHEHGGARPHGGGLRPLERRTGRPEHRGDGDQSEDDTGEHGGAPLGAGGRPSVAAYAPIRLVTQRHTTSAFKLCWHAPCGTLMPSQSCLLCSLRPVALVSAPSRPAAPAVPPAAKARPFLNYELELDRNVPVFFIYSFIFFF